MSIEKLRPSFTFDSDRLHELAGVVPEAFADGKINWDTLREAIGEYLEDETQEHFGLFWPGKRDAKHSIFQPSRSTLIPQAGKGKNEQDSMNLFIEGDNLEVLKLLQKSYAHRIRLAYIDPPYNTGNDFIYYDDFRDPLESYFRQMGLLDENDQLLSSNHNASGRYHSKWLSMMYPRLVIARNLLTDDGIIVIHIDEHELANLVLIMKEIFGEENELGIIVWDKLNPKGDATGIAYQHEFIVVFSKDKECLTANRTIQRPKKNAETITKKARELFETLGKYELPDGIEQMIKKYKISADSFSHLKVKRTLDVINQLFSTWIREQDFSGGEAAYSSIDENGEVFRLVSMAWPNKKKAPDEYFTPLIHPISGKPCPIPARGWRYPIRTMQELIKEKKIIFGKDETTQPQRKYLLRENMFENIPSVIKFGGSDDQLFAKMGILFDNPKPLYIAKQIVTAFTDKADIVLDFFAGSGTVAQGVLEVNELDHGNRRYICIQLPEPIEETHEAYKKGFRKVTDIFIHRMNYVYERYEKEGSKQDFGYRVYKLSRSNYRIWSDYQGNNTEDIQTLFSRFKSPLVDGWKEEELLPEILLTCGLPLNTKLIPIKTININRILETKSDYDESTRFICLDKTVFENTVAEIASKGRVMFVCLDSALSDEQKVKLSDSCTLLVI